MMAVVLKAKDASDWCYRGEGAVNLVLSYSGKSPKFIGKVLRIQKTAKIGSPIKSGDSALTSHECLLWREAEDLKSAPTREIAEHLYVKHIMSRILGSEHVDPGMRILVSKEFLEAVEKKFLSQRPSWRVNAAEVNLLCDSVLLISDHSIFPRVSLKEEFSLCIEIKPKCGFLPESKYMDERNAIKRRVTRFKMHQALKLHEGKISEISEFDPLDLFAGSKDRVHKAISALYRTPQNNFRVFLNGSLIFGGLGGGIKSTNHVVGQDFEGALKFVIGAEDGMRTECFLELITEALYRSGLLDRLLDVQKRDSIDIEGAIHAYYDVISQPCNLCRNIDANTFPNRYSNLHSKPLEESLKIVRDYLIAATAKDLSMMLSFRGIEKRDVASSYDVLLLESTNQTFDYKVSFIDLDMKPLKKMEYYYELDQKIVQFYIQMVKKAEACIENDLCTAENLDSDKGKSVKDDSRVKHAAGNKMEYQYELDQKIVQFYTQMVKAEPCIKNDLCTADKGKSVKDDSCAKHAAACRYLRLSEDQCIKRQIRHSYHTREVIYQLLRCFAIASLLEPLIHTAGHQFGDEEMECILSDKNNGTRE